MSILIGLAALVLFAALAAGCFFAGSVFGRGPSTTHYGGIGKIRELGELVVLRVECGEHDWAYDRDAWYGRGRSLLVKCDLSVEYRFNLHDVVIRHAGDAIDLVMPPPTITVAHGDVQVVHMQHGTILGVPCRRLGVHDINRLLAEARANIDARRERGDDYLAARARDQARSILLAYAALAAPAEKIRVLFDDAPASLADDRSAAVALAAVPATPPLAARPRLPGAAVMA